MINLLLAPGANAPVNTEYSRVLIRWTASKPIACVVDVSAFLVGGNGKVSGRGDVVFYNQMRSADGSVSLERGTGFEPKEAAVAIALSKTPETVERVALAVSLGEAAPDRPLACLDSVEVTVEDGAEELKFLVPTAMRSEAALILGEFYRRNGSWKFRAIGHGFANGFKPLAESFGAAVADEPRVVAPPPVPPAPISLSKISLSKSRPSVDLQKKPGGFGEVRVNLNWNRGPQSGGLRSLFGRSKGGIDLDVGCLYELQNGQAGVVQALGDAFGSLEQGPYIRLAADDRTGASTDGEWLTLNGTHWGDIRRVLIFAFIYEGVPNWAATDGVVTVHVQGSAPVEVKLDEESRDCAMCAIALIENAGGEMRISRQVRYFQGHSKMDKAYRWGLRWAPGAKN